MSENQPNKSESVRSSVWPAWDHRRTSAFLVGLVVIVIGSLIAAELIGSIAGGSASPIQVLLELAIAISAIHLVSVCAGLWFADQDLRWLVVASAFALAGLFCLAQLLGYLDGGANWQEQSALGGNSAVAVALLASVFALTAGRLNVRVATTAIGTLVVAAAILFYVLRADAGVLNAAAITSFNAGLYLVAISRALVTTRGRGIDATGAAIGLACLLGLAGEVVAFSSGSATGVAVLFCQLGVLVTLYIALFVLALLVPYGRARHAEAFFRTLVESSPAGIVLSRADRILHANQAFLDLLGFASLKQAREAYLWDLGVEDSEERESEASWSRAPDAGQGGSEKTEPVNIDSTAHGEFRDGRDRAGRGEPNTVVRRLAARDGRIIHARVEHADVVVPDGKATLTYFIDFSKTVEAQEQLKRVANYDVLTGLPNRTMLRGQLEQALRVAGRIGDMVAVLFIDLDQFKQVNDTLGHASGDELLKMVADRLRNVSRKEDTLGRLGGDEFILVGEHIQSRNGAATLAAKLIQALDTPFNLEGHEVFVGGSIGVSLYPHDAEDASTMIRNADVAMYHAKRGGGPRVAFYEEEMNARALERLELGTELRWALDRDEFEMFYQPRVDLKSGRLAGVEALLRWRSPTRGLILPEKIIPRLEESSLITQLGRQVLAKACHAAMKWRAQGFGRIPVAVNLSAAQFRGSVVEDVEVALSASGLPHEDLELEITESLLFRDYEQARVPLEKLTAKGVRAALDDFGTGYSSLSSLHHLPVHFVKIDRSFVQALQPGRNTIVAAIVNVAHTLGMRVIAEGVETTDQRDILIELGCDEMQGYLFARAMSAEEFLVWLGKHHKPQLVAVSDDS
ncbi:MAG: EAL domain-containing protein [Burkholderiales bacterium]